MAIIIFLVIYIWALIDGSIYGGEAIIQGVIGAALIAGHFFLPDDLFFYAVAGLAIQSIVLIFKVFGGDISMGGR